MFYMSPRKYLAMVAKVEERAGLEHRETSSQWSQWWSSNVRWVRVWHHNIKRLTSRHCFNDRMHVSVFVSFLCVVVSAMPSSQVEQTFLAASALEEILDRGRPLLGMLHHDC